jgi:hypothetical protein
MRQTISGLVAAIAVVTASAVPAMACGGGGLFGSCSPCGTGYVSPCGTGYVSPCAQTYVPAYRGPRIIATDHQAPRIYPRMIRLCSRFDSVLFTPKISEIPSYCNYSRSPILIQAATPAAAVGPMSGWPIRYSSIMPLRCSTSTTTSTKARPIRAPAPSRLIRPIRKPRYPAGAPTATARITMATMAGATPTPPPITMMVPASKAPRSTATARIGTSAPGACITAIAIPSIRASVTDSRPVTAMRRAPMAVTSI